VLAVLGAGWTCAAAAAIPNRPLRTGIYLDADASIWDRPGASILYNRIPQTGATVVRTTIFWAQVAPAKQPVDWDPTDPADANYDWSLVDGKVRNIVARHLEPLVTIMAAPKWAQRSPAEDVPNSRLPDPQAFADFATAAARRYSGKFEDLPRVRWWQAWNEPNISLYLVPQLENDRPVAPAWYRRMLNEFAGAVHAVNGSNLVVAGGLAPFRDITQSVHDQDPDWGPLSFMRALLCLSASLKATCNDRAAFDVWATHPYTSGGPFHEAVLSNDVSLGDLPEMRKTLNAAIKAGHVRSRHAIQFWITEFSWDSSPPDPEAVPMTLLKRWVAQGLYAMWQNGVSLVTWLMMRDLPYPKSYLQSGLYFSGATYAGDKPKPIVQAFRFPLVALPQRSGVLVWGRTPAGKPGRVLVERTFRGGWSKLGVLRTNRYGIFQRTFRTDQSGTVRARVVGTGAKAAPFGIKVVPDHFYNPFGQAFGWEPPKTP
jgi:hypothetical protein